MKRSRFTTEQIIGVLKEHQAGIKVPDLVRKHGISGHTFYRWKAKYGDMEVSEARRLKELKEENRRLKHMVADQALDIQALKAVLGQKW
jgi:putative transposase